MSDATVARALPQEVVTAIDEYTSLGWAVFPAYVSRKLDADGREKKSLQPPGSWPSMSTSDRDEAIELMSRHPTASLCIDTGKSGLVVVDVDDDGVRTHGLDNLAELGLTDTPRIHRTPSGGFHLYYRADPDDPVSISASKVAPNVDIRAMGGLVIAPPSSDWRGSYSVNRCDDRELPPVPTGIRTAIARANSAKLTAVPAQSRFAKVASTVDGPSVSGTFVPVGAGRVSTPHYTEAVASGRILAALTALRGTARYSGFNHALNEASFELGHWVGSLLTEDVAYGLLAQCIREVWGADPDSDDLQTIRSGFHAGMAKPYGLYSGAAAEIVTTMARDIDADVEAMRGKLLDDDGLRDIPAPVPLVDGLLFRDSLARVNGASGHGKSFITLDIAASVATGTPWHGRTSTPGKVLYVVAEGVSGFSRRVEAWRQHHQVRRTGLLFYPEPIQIMGDEWPVLIRMCEQDRPDMIWFDTQARVTVGTQENDAMEMGIVVDKLEQLRVASGGACVVLVHHTPHAADRGRGSGAVVGAMNTELLVAKNGRMVSVRVTKQKDAPEIEPLAFELTDVGDTESVVPVLSSVPVSAIDADEQAQVGLPRVLHTESELVSIGDLALHDKRAVVELALFMSVNAVEGRGYTLADANRAFREAETRGTKMPGCSRSQLHIAWQHLMEVQAIVPSGTASGPYLWAR